VPFKRDEAAGLRLVQLGEDSDIDQLEAVHRIRLHRPSLLEVLQRQLHQLMQNRFRHVRLEEAVVPVLAKHVEDEFEFNPKSKDD
jgi:hypothetical protein